MSELSSAEVLLGLLVALDKMPGVTTTFTSHGTKTQAHHRLKLEFNDAELERASRIKRLELIRIDDPATLLHKYYVDVTEVER